MRLSAFEGIPTAAVSIFRQWLKLKLVDNTSRTAVSFVFTPAPFIAFSGVTYSCQCR